MVYMGNEKKARFQSMAERGLRQCEKTLDM